MNSKRKAVAGAIGATAIGAAVVMTGASSAYFFDAEAVKGNKIQAGTLDLSYTISGSAVENGRIIFKDVKPADLKEFTLKVTNKGSVEGRVSAGISNVVNAENGIWEPEAEFGGDKSEDSGELDEKMRVSVGKYFGELRSVGLADIGALVNAELSKSTLKPGASKEVTFQVALPTRGSGGVQNDVMSDSFSFDLDLALSQK